MNMMNTIFAAALFAGAAAAVAVAPAAAQVSTSITIHEGSSGGPASFSIGRSEIDVTSRVTIVARGFRHYARLIVSAGRNPYRLSALRSVRTDANGRLAVSVRLPEWAEPGRSIVFAIQTAGGRVLAVSRPVRIVDSSDDEGSSNVITVVGELLEPNATCPRLAGDDGRIYALAGNLREFDTGDRVRVTGALAETSICNQRRTIDVERIRGAE